MRVLILQHISCEPPGIYEDILTEKGASMHRVEIDQGDELPDWRGYDAIIAMGGPMSVNDVTTLPWLTVEKALGQGSRARRTALSGAFALAFNSSPPAWGQVSTPVRNRNSESCRSI